jgi:pimeloyl-ACP methyl ester carboxylesterase
MGYKPSTLVISASQPLNGLCIIHPLFIADAQTPTADSVFHAVILNPAWRLKPSWYMVAGADRIINPDLQRMYAKNANSRTVEIQGASHAVFESHPREIVKLIIEAATEAGKK